MADDTAPPTDILSDPRLNALLAQLTTPPPAPQQGQAGVSPNLSTVGLLGSALGGGPSASFPMTDAEQEAAGRRALMNFGMQMMAGSGWSTQPRTFNQVLAQGLSGAEASMSTSQAQAAARQAATQDWQLKQQELRMTALKDVLPTLLQAQRAQALAGIPSSTGTTTAGGPPAKTTTGNIIPTEYAPMIEEAAQKYGIPVEVAQKLFSLESDYNAGAINKDSKATGLGQVLPSTAVKPGMGVSPLADNEADAQKALLDPKTNINFSLQYLAARGKALYGDKWDPTNPDQIKGALNAYGGAPIGGNYAEAVMGRQVGGAPKQVVVATNTSTATQPPAQPAPAPAPATVAAQTSADAAASDKARVNAGEPVPAPPPPAPEQLETAPDVQAASARAKATGKNVIIGDSPKFVVTPQGTVVAAPAQTQPATTTTTQPATPPPVVAGQTQPAPTTSDNRTPGGPPVFNYQQHAPPPGYVPSGDLSPDEQATIQRAYTAYNNAVKAADLAGDPTARANAEATLQKTLDTELTTRAGRTKDSAAAIKDWYTNDYNQQKEAYSTQLTNYYAMQKDDNQARIASRQKLLDAIDADAKGARESLDQLDTAQALSDAAGKPGFLTNMPEFRAWLTKYGLATPDQVQQWSAQDALGAASNKLILALRNGSGFSRMTNLDLQFLQNTAPDPNDPQPYRDATLAFLKTTYQRQQRYAAEVHRGIADGLSIGDAQDRADALLGSAIPTLPTNISPNAQQRWLATNAKPHTFYRVGNDLKIFNPPQGWKPPTED